MKKLGEMSFRGKCQREKRRRENCHLGRNVLRPEKSVLTSQQHHLLRPVSLPHQKEEKVKVRFPSGLFQITFSFFLSASSFQMFVHHHVSEDEGDMRFCFIPNNLMFENWMVVVEVVWYVVLSSSQMELQSL